MRVCVQANNIQGFFTLQLVLKTEKVWRIFMDFLTIFDRKLFNVFTPDWEGGGGNLSILCAYTALDSWLVYRTPLGALPGALYHGNQKTRLRRPAPYPTLSLLIIWEKRACSKMSLIFGTLGGEGEKGLYSER